MKEPLKEQSPTGAELLAYGIAVGVLPKDCDLLPCELSVVFRKQISAAWKLRSVPKTPAKPNIPSKVREVLEAYFWLPTLAPNTRYARLHDDHDGQRDGWLAVTIGEDGDAWVDPVNITQGGLRFRMPFMGGGMSQYTRTALVILAEAIRLDNETHPQRPAVKTTPTL